MDTPKNTPQPANADEKPKAAQEASAVKPAAVKDAPAQTAPPAPEAPAAEAGPEAPPPEDAPAAEAESSASAAKRQLALRKAKDGFASLYKRSGGWKGWLRRPVFWLTILPIVLSSLYFGLIATDMYVSEAEMVVRNSKAFTTDSGTTLFAATSISTVNPDSYVVYEYTRSQDLMRILDSEIDLRKHYSMHGADPVSGLWGSVSDENLLKFFQSVVNVTLDSTTGVLKLKVRAFDPETAHRIAQKVIKYSEALVNRMNERSVKDTLGLAQAELSRAEARVSAARLKIKEFRTTHADFNPGATVTAAMTTLAGLLDDQAKASAELTQLRSFMREDSPQVISSKSKVAAISKQVAAEQLRLTGGGNGKTSDVLEYENLASEYDFAQKQLDGARAVMEQSRVQVMAKTRYLEAFVQPNLPEEATYPTRLLAIGETFIITFLAYGLIMLVWAAIREHVGF